MNKRVLTGVLAILLFMAGFVRAGAVSYHEGDVEEYVIQQLAAANIPGVSLSIVTSQKEIYSVAFGDVKETSSNLQICALTRTFTTLAVMQLVEKGSLNLSDKVSKYIKDPSQNIAYSTTVQDLLSYTRPGTHELALADTLEIYNTGTEGEELPLNTKFNLLGEVVEAVSGMDYAEYINENIITPLDLQSTYTIGSQDSALDITQGSRNYFGLPLKDNIEYKEEDYWLGVPSNGLVSNVKDMGKYMQMYLSAGGKVISYNTMEAIINNKGEYTGKSIFGTDAYYSMGWISTEVDGEQVYYCNGSVENYTSAMFIIPSMDVGVVILFNSADALTGQKYTDEIEAGAVSLVMGRTAKAVSSNSYLMEHGVADIIYFLAFVCAIMPLLMMEVWVRWTKDKFSIIRLLADILIHIVLPTALIFAASHYIAPWKIIMKAMPDLFFLLTIVIGLFYLGLVVKIIAFLIILLKGGRENSEEDIDEDTVQYSSSYINTETDNDENRTVQEDNIRGHIYRKNEEKRNRRESKNPEEEKKAKENKDRLLKRMKDIKEAEKSETENRKEKPAGQTETEAGQTAEEELPEEILTGGQEQAEYTEPELTEEDITDTSSEIKTEPESKTAVEEDITRGTGTKKNTEPKQRPGTEKGRAKPELQSSLKNRQGQDRQYNKPKRFVVVNDAASAPKRTKGNSITDNKKNSNRSGSKNSLGSRNRNNKNTNSATNRKKSSYNSQGSRTNPAREGKKNNTGSPK